MTADATARLLVMTPDEIAPGYRLAGADTLTVADATETAKRLTDLLDAGTERGVVAVHEPFYAALDPALRRRAEATLPPLIVALPAGGGAQDEAGRRERMLQMLWQAVGYEITFDAETTR